MFPFKEYFPKDAGMNILSPFLIANSPSSEVMIPSPSTHVNMKNLSLSLSSSHTPCISYFSNEKYSHSER